MTTSKTEIVRTDDPKADSLTVMEKLAEIPEEEIWLTKQPAPARGGPTGSTCSISRRR
jgi:hypothetical protein